MKYLKKIFESTKEEQVEDIESIFTEYLDQKYIADDGEEYSICFLETKDSPQYVLVTIENYIQNAAISDIQDFDKIYKERFEYLEMLKKIRVSLLRLENMGYTWAMSFDEDGFHIKVFYKDTVVTLADCFGGEMRMRSVDEPIMKRYMKDNYNLKYNSSHYTSETGGYYGRRANIMIYFNNQVPEKLVEDLRKLKRKYDIYSTSTKKEIRTENAFYSVEIIAGGVGVKLEL